MTVSCNSIQVILALVAIILVILGRRPLLHLVIFLVMLQAVVLIFVGAMMVRSLFIPLTQTEDSIQNEINEQLNQTLRFHNHFEHPNDPNNFDYFSTYMDNKDVWRKYMDKHLCCGFNGYSDYPENMMVPIQCQCFCTNITEYEPPSRTIEGLSKTASSTWFKVFEKVRQMGPSVVHQCTQFHGGQCEPELLPYFNITVTKGQPGCSKRIARQYHELFSFVEHVKTIVVTSVAWLHLLLALVHFCIHQNPY